MGYGGLFVSEPETGSNNCLADLAWIAVVIHWDFANVVVD